MATPNAPASDRLTSAEDNRPPLVTLTELRSDYGHYLEQLDHMKLSALECPVEINSDDISGRWQEWIKDLDKVVKSTEASRVDAKQPFLAAERSIDGFFKGLQDDISKVRRDVANIVASYLTRKRDAERARLEAEARKKREEEERLRQEAADRAEAARKAEERNRPTEADNKQLQADIASQKADEAASQAAAAEKQSHAKSADLARTRSAGGALGTLGDHWDFEITDIALVKGAPIWAYITHDAKEKAVRAYMRANAPKTVTPGQDWQPLAGVRFFRTSKLQVR